MNFRSAFAVLSMTMAVTACGELPFQKSEDAAPAGHSGPPTVSPVDQPIETGADGVAIATAESSTMNTAMFRASGAGWTATAADKRAVYERSGAKSTAVTVRRMTYARGVEFVGTMNGSVFSLNIQAGECQAGDQRAPFTAKLRVGSQNLTGCAVATDTMPKAQVTASSAAPKPKAAAKKPAAAAPAAAATEAATTTPAPTTPPATPTPASPEPAATAPATPAPATPAPAPAAETPAPAPVTTAPASPATEAPAASEPAVPAPELVLPPAPPAASE